VSAAAAIADSSRVRLPVLQRPRTRGECIDGPRPCQWTTCRHHLASDLDERPGEPKFVLKHDPATMAETCSLDFADRGGGTLGEVGAAFGGLTRERIRQIQVSALANLIRTLRRLRLLPRDKDAAEVLRAVMSGLQP
jgi:hypothetical protein